MSRISCQKTIIKSTKIFLSFCAYLYKKSKIHFLLQYFAKNKGDRICDPLYLLIN